METRKRPAEITHVERLGPGLGRVDLVGKGIGQGVAPGRFAMVEAPGRPDCILLRPYSYFTADKDTLSLLVKDVGKGTHGLLSASPGTPVAVLGPLGNNFPQVDGPLWMVAGGVGAAPFGIVGEREEATVLFGARTEAESGFATALRETGSKVTLATDDGSAGFHGSVVALLEKMLASERPRAIFTCGPTPMMNAVAQVAFAHDVDCWASLEERMGCGIGVCRGCAHADASGGWRCICVDGPVYPAKVIFAPRVAPQGGEA